MNEFGGPVTPRLTKISEISDGLDNFVLSISDQSGAVRQLITKIDMQKTLEVAFCNQLYGVSAISQNSQSIIGELLIVVNRCLVRVLGFIHPRVLVASLVVALGTLVTEPVVIVISIIIMVDVFVAVL